MKKVLTVLLVIAVMFTFSFGSAFAVSKDAYNGTLAETYFKEAMKAIADSDAAGIELSDDGTHKYFVDYDTLAKFEAELLDAAVAYAKDEDSNVYVGKEGCAVTIKSLIELKDDAATTAVELDNSDLLMNIVAAQYATDKQEAIDRLNGLDTSDYSTAELTDALKDAFDDSCDTYVEHVKELINDAISEINKATFTTDSDVEDYLDAKATINNYFDKYDVTPATKLAVEKSYAGAGGSKVGLGVYELNENYTVPKTTKKLKDFTTTAVSGADAVDAAQTAVWKADIAQKYASYLSEKDADKDFAADVKKVMDYVAENGSYSTGWNFFNIVYKDKFANAIANVEQFEVEAARLAAETDANGVLVRDAEDVADLVTKGIMNEYLVNAIGTAAGTKYNETLSERLDDIRNLYVTLDDELLAFEKKVRETYVANFLADCEENDTYYPLELAKVKALTDEYLEKVNAITDVKKVAKYDNDYFGVADIDTFVKAENFDTFASGKIADVNQYGLINDKAAALYTDVKEYAKLVNKQISKADNKYYDGTDYAKLKKMINELVGNSEARTDKEIKALYDQAAALVKSLPTKGAVDAARDAADDAVKALPKTAKIADKALVDAAIAAVDAFEDLSGEDYFGNNTDKVAEAVVQYAYAFNNEMTAKVKAVDKTDKAAVKALKSEITEFVTAYEDYAATDLVKNALADNKAKLQGYLNDIQDAAAAAVRKAIAAIPEKANITEADKPVIAAARAAYDAYVAEYTNYEDPYVAPKAKDGFVADDFEYNTLVTAETLVGLNATTDAEKVEALKITAKSTAKKGSITVKWTVKGDASVADGFQVWKSTKHSKGYKKAFTTTKQTYKNTKGLKAGTRYYYKVRAYKVVDGKNVYSDWSNKARRVAK